MTPPPPTPPSWPHCGEGADPVLDPVGCHGIHVPGHTCCLAHLATSDRAAYLATLSPGDDVDYRATTFALPLLDELFDALRDPTTTRPRLGSARFDAAVFSAEARFEGVTFSGDAVFDQAVFSAIARFEDVTFSGDAEFDDVQFSDEAVFDEAMFSGIAAFRRATFAADANFRGATFSAETWLWGATFFANAWLRGAAFTSATRIGPLVCQGRLDLTGAVFSAPVTIEAAAASVQCGHTQWESRATLHLRYASINLSGAVITQPIAVTAHPSTFLTPSGAAAPEAPLAGADPGVRVTSLRGVDAAHLVLTDTDLTTCVFTGAFHLDQLSLAGDTHFAAPPTGWRLRNGIPARLARRRTIAEEHHWRALTSGNPPPPHGWTPGPHHPNTALTPDPEDVGPVYRALRKASEDAKNEPDAADFYYGEMEMRRHDHKRPTGERALITAYWLLSGYGLRATRALGWLLLAMTITILAMMLWGLPTSDPKPRTTGVQVATGQRAEFVTDNPDPTLTGPVHDRLTAKRAEKATRVVVNSVVFRSSGQNLTKRGAYIEMTSRLLEPVLLALAILAIRGRVKR
ncbi:pentapeptide repeat-containing protein [Embleya sp. NPDC008237]|uniref:pentapeptide repeat-containing protein n=1 Tax=Embleya sp. NPDC008237 TaxID=3363978 RepID=UPI0036E1A77F